MCGVPQKEASRGTDQELRAGLPFSPQRRRWLAGGGAERTADVMSPAPWPGQGAGPVWNPQAETGPPLAPGLRSSAGYLGASGRPEMRWTVCEGPTLSQVTRPRPRETTFKFLEHPKHFPVSGPALAKGVPSASGSLRPQATSPRVSSQKGLPAERAPTSTPWYSPWSNPLVSFSVLILIYKGGIGWPVFPLWPPEDRIFSVRSPSQPQSLAGHDPRPAPLPTRGMSA